MKEKEIIKNVIENKRVVTGPDYRDMGAILLFILLPYIVSFSLGMRYRRNWKKICRMRGGFK